jgi:hypothetical protein
MLRLAVLVFGLLASAGTVYASPDYSDDRSTAESLVRSLYNAINRHEYARAYDYFAQPPARSFDAYASGFANTDTVDVLTGAVTADGTAGSIYYNVPTAIRAKDTNGKLSYFAGCYTIRAINGAIQDPPSRPFLIDQAKLKPSAEEDYSHFNLPSCGEGGEIDASNETPEDDRLLVLAKAQFVAEMGHECDKVADTKGGANEPQAFEIKYKPEGAGADEPESRFSLFAFSCSMAAYNESNVFYAWDTVFGMRRLSFAEPHLQIKYEDEEQAKLKSMTVDGLQSSDTLTNAEYDPATKTINSLAKWRGIGDAASHGSYKFVDGQFVLKDFDVDPTTDEAINPYAIVKDGQVLAQPELLPEEQ